jgi:uncharacterized membrane protein YkvA (DUF1232 family)
MWFGAYVGSWPDFAALARGLSADEARLRRQFWRKLKREAASIPMLEQLLSAYYCAFDRNTPLYAKALVAGAIAYFVVPKRLLPKQLALIVVLDDAAIIAAACKAVSSHVKAEHREAARRAVARLRGEATTPAMA